MERICLVIPCFNEESRLDQSAFLAFVKEHEDVHLLFVDDGSSDGTWDCLEAMKAAQANIHLLRLPENRGKAATVDAGMRAGLEMEPAFSIYGFLDADLATPLAEISRLLKLLIDEPQLQFVFGSRHVQPGEHIKRSFTRRVVGRIFAFLAARFLQFPIWDTQCGAKVMRAELVPVVFGHEAFFSRWLFDIEIFARLKHHFGTEWLRHSLREEPLLRWKEVGSSRITLRDGLKFPGEFWQIVRHYR